MSNLSLVTGGTATVAGLALGVASERSAQPGEDVVQELVLPGIVFGAVGGGIAYMSPRGSGHAAAGFAALGLGPVSYTHLTLPTICSV